MYGTADDQSRRALRNLGWTEVEVNKSKNYVLWCISAGGGAPRCPNAFISKKSLDGPEKTSKATGGTVWMVTERGMYAGKYSASTNSLGQFESSHMNMFLAIINQYGQQKPLFAGSIKANGQWGGNSAFNDAEVADKAFRYQGLNGPVSAGLNCPWEAARDRAIKIGDVPCSSQQLAYAQQIYSQGKHFMI